MLKNKILKTQQKYKRTDFKRLTFSKLLKNVYIKFSSKAFKSKRVKNIERKKLKAKFKAFMKKYWRPITKSNQKVIEKHYKLHTFKTYFKVLYSSQKKERKILRRKYKQFLLPRKASSHPSLYWKKRKKNYYRRHKKLRGKLKKLLLTKSKYNKKLKKYFHKKHFNFLQRFFKKRKLHKRQKSKALQQHLTLKNFLKWFLQSFNKVSKRRNKEPIKHVYKLENQFNFNRDIKRNNDLFEQSKFTDFSRKIHYRFLEQRKSWAKVPTMFRQMKFRKFLNRYLGKFRRIKKHKFFNSLLRGYFEKLTGFTEKYFLNQWKGFKQTFERPWLSGAASDLVTQFSKVISFRLEDIGLQLNLTSSPIYSEAFARVNSFVINGLPITTEFKSHFNLKYRPQPLASFKPRDILNINAIAFFHIAKTLLSYRVAARLFEKSFDTFSYLQSLKSMLMYGMIQWPHLHEIKHQSFRSINWYRYYIRNLPSKSSRYYRKAKSVWGYYPRRIFAADKGVSPRRQRR